MEYVELVIKIPKEKYNAIKIYRTLPAEMKELGLEAIRNGRKYETVTDFANRCRECGAKYGQLLRDMEEIREVMGCDDADAETKCRMISYILTAKPHYFERPEPQTESEENKC